jgi:hypothetical protein
MDTKQAKVNNNDLPTISAGSFGLVVLILAVGAFDTKNCSAGGIMGCFSLWPGAVSSLIGAAVILVSMFSPKGSIFALAKEVIGKLASRQS